MLGFASRFSLALVAVFAACSLAHGQHAHDHKPKHGGLIREANEFVYELKATPAEIMVWVTDERDQPVPTRGSSARLTLIESGSRVEVALASGDGNRFVAKGAFTVKPGMSALLQVSIGGKEIAKLRYTLK